MLLLRENKARKENGSYYTFMFYRVHWCHNRGVPCVMTSMNRFSLHGDIRVSQVVIIAGFAQDENRKDFISGCDQDVIHHHLR